MIRRCQCNYPSVCCEPIQLVQEERAVLRRQQRIEIFQDKETGSSFPRSLKDGANILFIGFVLCSYAFDVETGLAQGIDDRLDCVCFAIARRSKEQHPALPGDMVALIDIASGKEMLKIVT